MSKETILIYICSALFALYLYQAIQNVKLKNLMNEQIKDLLGAQIAIKSRLDMAEASRANIVTLRCSKVVSKQKMYDIDFDMSLEMVRREILKELSEELDNYVTYHMYDDKMHASIEVVGFLRFIKEEVRAFVDEVGILKNEVENDSKTI